MADALTRILTGVEPIEILTETLKTPDPYNFRKDTENSILKKDKKTLEDFLYQLEDVVKEFSYDQKSSIPVALGLLNLEKKNVSKPLLRQFFNQFITRIVEDNKDIKNALEFHEFEDSPTNETSPEDQTSLTDLLQLIEELRLYIGLETKTFGDETSPGQTTKDGAKQKEDDKEKLAAAAGAVLASRQARTPASQGGLQPQATVPQQPQEQQTQQLSPEEVFNFSQQNFHLNQEILRETISLENYLISAFEFDKSLNLNSFPPELRELVRTQVTVTFNSLNIAEFIGEDGKINITKLRFAIFKKALQKLQQNPIFLAELQLLDEKKLKETSKDPNAKSEDTQHKQKVATLVSDVNISSHVEKDVAEEEGGKKFSKLKDEEFKKQMYQIVVFEELKSPKVLDQIIASATKNASDLKKFPDLAFDLQPLLDPDIYQKFLILSPADQQKILSALDFRLQNPLSLPEKIRNRLTRSNVLSPQDQERLLSSLDLSNLANIVVSEKSLGLIFANADPRQRKFLETLSEDSKRKLIRNLQDLQAHQTNLQEQKFERKQLLDRQEKLKKDQASLLKQLLKQKGIDGVDADNVVNLLEHYALSRADIVNIVDDLPLLNQINPELLQSPEFVIEAQTYTVMSKGSHPLLTFVNPDQTSEDVENDIVANQQKEIRRRIEEETNQMSTELGASNLDDLNQQFSSSAGGVGAGYRNFRSGLGLLNKARITNNKKRVLQLGKQIGTKLLPFAGLGAGVAGVIHTLTQAVGALQGLGLGAMSGALTGAAIGTIFPGIGTGIGFVVGGALGGIGGFLTGGARAGGAGLDFLTGAENASNAAKSLTKDAGSIVRNTAVQTTEAAGKVMAGSITSSTLPVAAIIIGTTTGILALSVYSMMTIYSAFLPDGDSSFVGYQSGEFSRYLDINKSASPTKLENGEVATITYTVTFTPKLGAEITISSITDKLTALPSGQPYKYIENSEAMTQISDALVNKPFTEPQTFSYSVDGVSGEDVLLTNKITANFIAKIEDQEYNEDLSGAASVRIGNPKVGCFEFASGGYSFLGNTTISWRPEEEDRITRSFLMRAGTNETYLNYLCEKGNIKIYRLPDSSSNQWHGWAPKALEGTSFALYSRAFSYSDRSLEYTLVHELGHIMDYRNPGLRSKFLLTRRTTSCFTYPFTDNCSEYEAFAEGTVLSVVFSTYEFSGGKYNFPQRNPVEYNWFKDTIFGGLECDANSCTN